MIRRKTLYRKLHERINNTNRFTVFNRRGVFHGNSYNPAGVFIRVTFLVDRLPPALKQLANHLAHLITLAFCVIILIATTQQAWRGLHDDTELSALPILVGPAYSIIPLGFLALTLLMLADLPRVHRGTSYLFRDVEAPSA